MWLLQFERAATVGVVVVLALMVLVITKAVKDGGWVHARKPRRRCAFPSSGFPSALRAIGC